MHRIRSARLSRLVRTLALALPAACGGSSSSTPDAFSPTYYDQDYTPATVARNELQWLDLYLPAGSAPPTGWPVLFVAPFGGFEGQRNARAPIASSSKLPFRALSSGIAVALCGLTSAVDGDDPEIPGHGTFDPPGLATPGQDHYDDDQFPIGFKDAVWVVQFLRANAATYGVDPERFACQGRSGAATAWAWVALGEERSDPSSGDFRAASSRVSGAILASGQFWWPAFRQSKPGLSALFPDAADPVNEVAGTLADTFRDYQVEASALFFGFRDTGVRALNAATPFYLYAGNPPGSDDYSFTDEPFPVPTLTDALTDGHDGWFQYALAQRLLDLDAGFHARATRLVAFEDAASGPAESAILSIEDELVEDQVTWLLELFAQPKDAASARSGTLLWFDENGASGSGAWTLRRSPGGG
jgi:hypothetical protein